MHVPMHRFLNIPYPSLHLFTHHVTSPTKLELTTGLIVPLPSDSNSSSWSQSFHSLPSVDPARHCGLMIRYNPDLLKSPEIPICLHILPFAPPIVLLPVIPAPCTVTMTS